MNIFDILLLIIAIAGIYFFLQKRKKRNGNDQKHQDNPPDLVNYNALRNGQSTANLHGMSIVSLYYDSALSYANMEKDGSNASFDLLCETKVNDVLKSLKSDGYTPTLNALSCVDRVIFYIIY